MLPEPIQAAALVTNTLDKLNIPYFLGGSFASIVHGHVRTTQDADIIADIRAENVPMFIAALTDEFFLDEIAIKEAVKQRGSFNILHRQSIFKIDIFISKDRPFEKSQFSRADRHSLSQTGEIDAAVASAEDTLLAKLEWFRQGSEVAGQQWRDALGVLKVQGELLDLQYLRHWASELGVSDLLEKLLLEK